MRPISCFYVSVSDQYDVFVFHQFDSGIKEYVWEFYCSDGIVMEYQFGILDDGQDLDKIEEIAVFNFESNNIRMNSYRSDL